MKSNKNSITIRWGAPNETGNYPIINYFLEAVSPLGSRIQKNYTDLTNIGSMNEYKYTFANLTPNTKYKVYVSAYNELGRGSIARQIFETVHKRPGQGNIAIFDIKIWDEL